MQSNPSFKQVFLQCSWMDNLELKLCKGHRFAGQPYPEAFCWRFIKSHTLAAVLTSNRNGLWLPLVAQGRRENHSSRLQRLEEAETRTEEEKSRKGTSWTIGCRTSSCRRVISIRGLWRGWTQWGRTGGNCLRSCLTSTSGRFSHQPGRWRKFKWGRWRWTQWRWWAWSRGRRRRRRRRLQ